LLQHVFSAGFRPFFLLAACNAWASMLPWLVVLSGTAVPTQGWPPHTLHAHEMLYGTVAPVIAGFLLTAVPNWTKSEPVRGPRLVGLVLLYLAGRLALVLAGTLGALTVAVIDIAFLPVLAWFVGAPIVRKQLWRNVPVVFVLLALSVANAAIHYGLATGNATFLRVGTHGAVYFVVILMLVISGRVVPAFTRNALIDRDRAQRIATARSVGAAAFVCGGLGMLTQLISPGHVVVAPLADFAGVFVLLRMRGWQSLATWRQPMLWVLHAGHLWIALGFLLLGMSAHFGIGIGAAALHGFTAGAMGTLMLGMMARVTLGHTGRSIEADPATVVAFVCVIAGAAVRIIGGLGPVGMYRGSMLLGGVLFSLAWFVYTLAYTGKLVSPRADAA
jgi:uncharacterized protein involved in response to NO